MNVITNNNIKCTIALAALQSVVDPEIGLNVVDLGLIYQIDFDETNKDIYTTTENGSSILAYNMGKMCPPYCKPGTAGISSDDADWGLGLTIVDRGDKGLTLV